MSEHRWQGYSHEELFAQINEGPGPDGSTDSVRRWSELTRALSAIDEELTRAVRTAMADWQGAAAENAREGLRPLSEWAVQAQHAATTMRERTEQQAEFISRARRDMPPPEQVTSEEPGTTETLLTHLFGGQTDYEQQEARQAAAEQHAYDVMRRYEASTQTNTTALASFTPPPRVVVDSGTTSTPGSGGSNADRAVTLGWTSSPSPSGVSVDKDRVGRPSGTRSRTGAPVHGRSDTTTSKPRNPSIERKDQEPRPHPRESTRSSTTSTTGRSDVAHRTTREAPTFRDSTEPAASPEPVEPAKPAAVASDPTADDPVTERVGADGFFDTAQTTALPVIGGNTTC